MKWFGNQVRRIFVLHPEYNFAIGLLRRLGNTNYIVIVGGQVDFVVFAIYFFTIFTKANYPVEGKREKWCMALVRLA